MLPQKAQASQLIIKIMSALSRRSLRIAGGSGNGFFFPTLFGPEAKIHTATSEWLLSALIYCSVFIYCVIPYLVFSLFFKDGKLSCCTSECQNAGNKQQEEAITFTLCSWPHQIHVTGCCCWNRRLDWIDASCSQPPRQFLRYCAYCKASRCRRESRA